ncbi:MAG: DeoR/GlpR family DNA-binding transcription regulator [Eubacterium sp.]|nr:DeoR/GlpR family DNA-binding transcription regulator [Eubacterium sp.]
MLTEERKAKILEIVNKKNSVSVPDLIKKFGVSESTIRRDITSLSREGKILKVHGGAVKLEDRTKDEEPSVLQKETINKDEKIRIARYAASLIQSGDVVFIDAGTTTHFMLDFITEKRATYVTNAVSHAKDLVRKGFKVLLIGGELKENTEAVVGADAILHIQKYHFTKGFFGTNGVNIKLGFTTPDVREALIKRVAIENTQAGQRFVLADHDKFGLSSAVTFSDFSGVLLVTDKYPGDQYAEIVDVKIVLGNS